MNIRTLLASLLIVAAPMASAHIVFEQKQAPAGSYYKGTLLVGHGCNGSATRAVTVTIPDGVQGVHPQPKPGWQLEIKRAKLAKPYTSHGKTIDEDVHTIRWFGNTLADEHFDEFRMLMKLPEQGGKLYFPVLQECESGKSEWTQIPADGQTMRDLKTPAAELEVLPPAGGHVHSH
ncbi:YcnI family protein [Cupriavidus metallidurans]|uniref:YcnI family copper-binding membrane protein n=1 Tax=Cupriavidus metallidurans TaxID=119219 RepID=UPI001CCADAB6|nr:YcnI family protein [Cupriavidus metallidurans]UBM11162.1 YcnI family protein [Cupriavidus metallidurans]